MAWPGRPRERYVMRQLVTGGAGFIGSNYVRHVLSSSDDEVTVLDALTYAGGRDTMADILSDPRVTFVHGDICDREVVGATVPGHDVIVHFAAESHVDRSIEGPDTFVLTNCLGTNVLCDVARQVGVSRFVHVSTDETYGSRPEGSFTEEDILTPSSPYSASKAGSDLIALGYRTTFGLPVMVTRCSNNYGPYQFPEKVIPLFITNLFDGLTVPVYGDGMNVRDWIHVADHCEGVDRVLRNGVEGEIYNLGGGNEVPNLELTRWLLELCGRGEDAIVYVPDRLGHDFRYSVDCAKARGLGWVPRRSLREGLEATVAWYRDNEAWWRPRKP